MDWLNYHHLYYFHVTAREGSIAAASKVLRLSSATISGQIRMLEEALGHALFDRVGRGLVLTEHGRIVQRYAESIFELGVELRATLAGKPSTKTARLRVGIAYEVPKLVAHRLLAPALTMPDPVQLVLRENTTSALLAELPRHSLDLVLTDSPITSSTRIRAYNHLLGESGVSFFATPNLAKRLKLDFPQRLHDAPLLLPSENSMVRPQLDLWFDGRGIRPRVVAEFDDSALMKVFGQHGAGIFPAPTILEKDIAKQYGVVAIGRTTTVKERFYAITVDRKIRHPVAVAIAEAAKTRFESHAERG